MRTVAKEWLVCQMLILSIEVNAMQYLKGLIYDVCLLGSFNIHDIFNVSHVWTRKGGVFQEIQVLFCANEVK